MDYIFPKPLKKGDTIGIIAPCGVLREPERIDTGVKRLKDCGFNLKLSNHLFDTKRYMAGTDAVRAEELNRFFADKEVDCILCARGGYGALRILDLIDYQLIRDNPKIFCGYSDVSALSAMLLKHAGLVTYSSPMLSGDWGQEIISNFTVDNFFNTLARTNLEYNLIGDTQATAKGIAWGGNLTTIASLCGRDFIPQNKFIFIIEDINEPVYKIDRALAQLCGVRDFCQNISGIVCGEFTNTENSDWLEEVLNEYASLLNVNLWKGLKLGHIEDKITFPIGGKCKITGNKIFFEQGT